ncbi:MAG: hypothetical protein V7749_01195 [Cocleimonas sp.]
MSLDAEGQSDDKSGIPPINNGATPYNKSETVETSENVTKEVNDESRNIFPLIVFIALFVILLAGAAVGTIKYLGGDDKSTSISMNTDAADKLSEPVNNDKPNQTAGDITQFIKPPLPKITKPDPIYEVVDSTKLSDVDVENISFIISQLNLIVLKMDKFERKLAGIDNNQNVQLTLAKETAENVVASITTTETIASSMLKQNAEVQQVKTIVASENNRKKELLTQPAFRVAAVSMWGKTAYLTVASVSDSNFEQQVVVGSTISNWTLSSVSVVKKESVWINLMGVTYVLALP